MLLKHKLRHSENCKSFFDKNLLELGCAELEVVGSAWWTGGQGQSFFFLGGGSIKLNYFPKFFTFWVRPYPPTYQERVCNMYGARINNFCEGHGDLSSVRSVLQSQRVSWKWSVVRWPSKIFLDFMPLAIQSRLGNSQASFCVSAVASCPLPSTVHHSRHSLPSLSSVSLPFRGGLLVGGDFYRERAEVEKGYSCDRLVVA